MDKIYFQIWIQHPKQNSTTIFLPGSNTGIRLMQPLYDWILSRAIDTGEREKLDGRRILGLFYIVPPTGFPPIAYDTSKDLEYVFAGMREYEPIPIINRMSFEELFN